MLVSDLQDSVKFRGKHHVSLCLELPGHESFLAIELPFKQRCPLVFLLHVRMVVD